VVWSLIIDTAVSDRKAVQCQTEHI